MVMVANALGTDVGYLAGRFPGHIGHLYSPGDQRGPEDYLPYALDNGAFKAYVHGRQWFDEPWRELLMWASRAKQRPLWALVPDIVANRVGTLDRWHAYAPLVRSHGFRPAFAVQDGMTFGDAPDDCVLFLGGTIDWKDAAIEPWCARFPGRVHVGRVNDRKRLEASYRAGAVSVDGTGWFRNNARAKRTGSETAGVLLRRWLEEKHDRAAI